MAHAPSGRSSANITHHFKGMHFPASKEELLERARDSGAGQDVIEVLESFSSSRGIPNCGRRHEGLWRSRSSAANRDHRSEAVRGAHGSAAKFARCGKAGGDWPSAGFWFDARRLHRRFPLKTI